MATEEKKDPEEGEIVADGAAQSRQPVPEEELRMSFSGPAVHANKMYVTVMESGVRLTFAETRGLEVPPVFRSAVFLSFSEALSLRDLLSRQLSGFEMAMEEIQKSEQKKDA